VARPVWQQSVARFTPAKHRKGGANGVRFDVVCEWHWSFNDRSTTTFALMIPTTFDKIFVTCMLSAFAALVMLVNTQCPSWLKTVLFG
jgi:hypothetical protein